jgi:hypothetical protein
MAPGLAGMCTVFVVVAPLTAALHADEDRYCYFSQGIQFLLSPSPSPSPPCHLHSSSSSSSSSGRWGQRPSGPRRRAACPAVQTAAPMEPTASTVRRCPSTRRYRSRGRMVCRGTLGARTWGGHSTCTGRTGLACRMASNKPKCPSSSSSSSNNNCRCHCLGSSSRARQGRGPAPHPRNHDDMAAWADAYRIGAYAWLIPGCPGGWSAKRRRPCFCPPLLYQRSCIEDEAQLACLCCAEYSGAISQRTSFSIASVVALCFLCIA